MVVVFFFLFFSVEYTFFYSACAMIILKMFNYWTVFSINSHSDIVNVNNLKETIKNFIRSNGEEEEWKKRSVYVCENLWVRICFSDKTVETINSMAGAHLFFIQNLLRWI